MSADVKSSQIVVVNGTKPNIIQHADVEPQDEERIVVIMEPGSTKQIKWQEFKVSHLTALCRHVS